MSAARFMQGIQAAVAGTRVSAGLSAVGRRGRATDLASILADPKRYREQIDRLHEQHVAGRGMHELRQGSVSLASVAARRDEVARLLARTVSAGEYRFRPAELRTIRVGGKRRIVFALSLADRLVHGVVSDALGQAIEPTLSERLYSYRAGRPWWRAAQDLAAFVREGRPLRATPQHGLYVMRRDVEAYTDSIPVDSSSPIWPMISEAFGGRGDGGRIASAAWDLVEGVVRPVVNEAGQSAAPRLRGVPTGQPISCVLFNLYLRDVDSELAGVEGAFYARYSDDVVFAHPDPGVVQAADVLLRERLAGRGLTLNKLKSRDLYLTSAGHRSDAWPAARGTQHVPLLGLRVTAAGTVGLDRTKARELVRDVRRRVESARAASEGQAQAAGLAAALVRRAVDPNDTQASARAAVLVRRVVTDRPQLAELDYRLARVVAGVLTGDQSVRALRRLPPRVLRRRHGLPSLVDQRNRADRPRRKRLP